MYMSKQDWSRNILAMFLLHYRYNMGDETIPVECNALHLKLQFASVFGFRKFRDRGNFLRRIGLERGISCSELIGRDLGSKSTPPQFGRIKFCRDA